MAQELAMIRNMDGSEKPGVRGEWRGQLEGQARAREPGAAGGGGVALANVQKYRTAQTSETCMRMHAHFQ